MRANWLVSRGEYAAAEAAYEQIVASHPDDPFAIAMLALCHEKQKRLGKAILRAEQWVRLEPACLHALQTAARLAINLDRHDEASAFLRQALALPEVRNEIPSSTAVHRSVIRLGRLIFRLPILSRRFPSDPFKDFELGAQTIELQKWKRWACEYLACREGREPEVKSNVVH
jgi:tetratricopeptide (TPR) repeat protein